MPLTVCPTSSVEILPKVSVLPLLTVVVAATVAPAFVVVLLLEVVVADVAPVFPPLCCFQIDDKAAPTAIPPIAVVKSKKLEVALEVEVIFILWSEQLDQKPKAGSLWKEFVKNVCFSC